METHVFHTKIRKRGYLELKNLPFKDFILTIKHQNFNKPRPAMHGSISAPAPLFPACPTCLACPTCPVKSLLPLFNRDEIFVVFISSGLNVYPACPVKREAGLSWVKSLLHLFLWGAFLEIQRLFNRDGISVYFISSGRSLFLWGVKFPE